MSQEVREAVARLEGWKLNAETNLWEDCDGWAHMDYEGYATHPIRDDIAACARVWDEYAGKYGWFWWRTSCEWLAQSGGPFIRVRETGHDAASELRDRWELLGLVLKARGVV